MPPCQGIAADAGIVGLLRRWAIDWLSRADPSACADILAPEYRILIGGFALEPRDAYIAGTLEQLRRFPGLCITIHELIWSGERAALRFTEHGAAARGDGRLAAWGGMALFRGDGRRLTECFAEEDYLARRRQLDSGRCDPIQPPAPAPWSTPTAEADPSAEAVVREWLAEARFAGVELDDGWTGRPARVELEDGRLELDELFSAGGRVAFHGRHRGRYVGGLPGAEAALGSEALLHFAGLVTVTAGRVASGHVIRDRLGLQRALTATAR
jgi:hypothetical protein